LTAPEASAILPEMVLPMTLPRTLAVVAIAAWLGIMAFFSFEVAPIVFKTIDRAIAGQAVTAVLPRYYRWGLALSGFALVASVLQAISGKSGRLRPVLGSALTALMVTMLIWASAVLMPRAEAARRTRDDTVFARTHRASIQVNLVTLTAGVAFLILEGVSRRRDR
jgi:hypothetical protein